MSLRVSSCKLEIFNDAHFDIFILYEKYRFAIKWALLRSYSKWYKTCTQNLKINDEDGHRSLQLVNRLAANFDFFIQYFIKNEASSSIRLYIEKGSHKNPLFVFCYQPECFKYIFSFLFDKKKLLIFKIKWYCLYFHNKFVCVAICFNNHNL